MGSKKKGQDGAPGEGLTREANVTQFSIGNADRYQGKKKRRYTAIDKRLNIILSMIQRKLLSRSDRVKSVDLHPTEPWVLASLYNGHVYIYNYETQVRCLQQKKDTPIHLSDITVYCAT